MVRYKNSRKSLVVPGKRDGGFEDDLHRSLLEYRRKGLADIIKLPVPFTIESQNGNRIKGYLRSKQLFDFAGTINGGTAVCFEAKKTVGTRLDFGNRGLKPHQARSLIQWGELGAISFLLWKCEHTIYRIDWEHLVDHEKKSKRKSFNKDDAELIGFQIARVGFYLDPLCLLA